MPSSKFKPIPTVKATDAAIDGKPLGSGGYLIVESGKLDRIRGFMLICNEQSASFVLQRKLNEKGKKRTIRVKLGVRGEMAVTEAHAKAIETLKLFNEGKNPNEIKKAEARGLSPDGHMTLSEAFDRYIAERKARGLLRETTVARLTSHYRNHLSAWGTRTMYELGQRHAKLEINDLHTKLTKENGWAVANSTIRLLSALYDRTAELEGDFMVNPCSTVILNEDRVRNTALDQTDLRFWWAQAARLHSPQKRAYWLTVALTGGRRTQMASSEWSEIDFDKRVWTFPDEHAKAGNGYKIPLSSFTLEFLTEWRKWVEAYRPGCQFVFPGKFPGTSLKKPRNDKQGLSAQSHALRHTWETAGVGVGLNDVEALMMLGHSLKNKTMRHHYVTPDKVDWKRLAEKQEEMTAYLLKGLGVSTASIADIIWKKVPRHAWKIGQKKAAKTKLALVS